MVSYSKSTPSVHTACACQGKCCVVGGGHLGEDGVGGDGTHIDLGWGGLFWVELTLVVAVAFVLAIIGPGLNQMTFPGRVTTQCTVVVDSPG